MKISVNQKRRRLLKLGSVAAILPVAGRAGSIASSPSSTTGGPSGVQSQTPNPDVPSTQPGSGLVSANQALLFQYDQPAVESSMQFQGLPVGNGRLGALAGGASGSDRGRAAREHPQGKLGYCMDCHGMSGQGYHGYLVMPRLAGQTPEYLENQLRAKFDFIGTPIRFIQRLRKRGERSSGGEG